MQIIKNVSLQKMEETTSVEDVVSDILSAVKKKGDKAVLDYTEKFDNYRPASLKVNATAIEAAYSIVKPEVLESLRFAAERIKQFAERQLLCFQELNYDDVPGITLGHHLIPVASCGCYIPAGRYPLPSSALMSIIPAKVAGVERIAAASPASQGQNGIHPAVLVAMNEAGADEIYCMGGAQAIGAFAYGTESVPPLDMIVGPGNKYVTEAKRQVTGTVGIDMLAGPSEAVIIADESADPSWIAADTLARCEHDPDSWAILLLSSKELAHQIIAEVEEQLKALKTRNIAELSWNKNCKVMVFNSIEEAAETCNAIAPEHLQLMFEKASSFEKLFRNYGSLFIGRHAPVAFGDYVSGPNHILPTVRCSRFASGVYVGTFLKISSYQKITPEGARYLAPHCARLAETEGLHGHLRSSKIRQ